MRDELREFTNQSVHTNPQEGEEFTRNCDKNEIFFQIVGREISKWNSSLY